MKANTKALIFDLDDTLVVEKASAESTFIETCKLAHERYGIPPAELHTTLRQTCRKIWFNSPTHPYCKKVGISSWEGLWGRFEWDNDNLRDLKQWAPTYRHESWHRSLQKHGVDDSDLARELAEAFMINRRKLHIVYDDVRPTIGALKPQYRLGLVTNGASDQQREKIEGAGIQDYFEAIVISGDIDIGKPNIRIFEKVLEKLDVKADKALMIGNSLNSDIRGAQNAGMRTIWLNRYGLQPDNSIIPDREIHSLTELKAILL